MPPEDSPLTRPVQTGSPDLAALVSSLAAAVSDLAARVDRMERNLSPSGAPVTTRQESVAFDPISPRPAAITAPLPPPRPAFNPLRETAEGAVTKTPASLEDRLGSQIFNRIAIVAILIGATLFLKLAMDNHWIGPLGRVLVGLVSGAGLILWSERFRRKEFAAFSYSLKAVGSGVLYLSLWASFQLYHLVPSQAAFALMLLVTLWNAWMAWAQSSELLAAYAIAGAFATPLLLSTGGNHQVFLFSYLLSIDLATIVLVRLEQERVNNWSRLLLGALPATIAYFIGWFSSFYSADQLASTSLFIALFFLAFLTVPFAFGQAAEQETVTPERPRQADPITNILLPLTTAVFASLAFYSVLEDSGHHAALAWVALLFAALYLAVMRLPQTVVAKAVHLSLAILFLTITIPLKATGRWITIGWLVEGVALLWISARLEGDEPPQPGMNTGIHRMLRQLSALALTLGFFGLLFEAFQPFGPALHEAHTAFFNLRFATELVGIIALGVAAYISARAASAESLASRDFAPNWHQFAAASTVALNLVALLAGVREIETFWQPTYAYTAESGLQTALSISGFFMLYGAALLAIGFWKRSPFLRWQALVLLLVAILKTFLYDVRSLSQGYRVASFLSLGVLLLAISFFYVRKATPSESK